jgi:hypothetical protein
MIGGLQPTDRASCICPRPLNLDVRRKIFSVAAHPSWWSCGRHVAVCERNWVWCIGRRSPSRTIARMEKSFPEHRQTIGHRDCYRHVLDTPAWPASITSSAVLPHENWLPVASFEMLPQALNLWFFISACFNDRNVRSGRQSGQKLLDFKNFGRIRSRGSRDRESPATLIPPVIPAFLHWRVPGPVGSAVN